MSTASLPRIGRQSPASRWWGLTVVCFGTMMSFLNITLTVSVLSPMQRTLHASSADLVWIASAYSMAVASLALSSGTLGDLFGRRRIFALGAAILALGSLLTFFAQSSGVVIAGQAIEGVGGAMIIPNALALVTHAFTEPHERSGAISIWATVSGVGLAVGPLIAGGLIKAFSWHSVFLVNVALGVLVLALTWPLITESRHPTRKLDPLGLVLAVIAVGALNYGVIQGGNDGFGATKIVIALAVFIAAVGAFIVAERRSASPMLQLALFRHPSFSVANLSAFIGQYAFVGVAFAEVLWFEQVKGASILSTGLHLLALMGIYVVTSLPAGRLARRVGFKYTISLGLVLIAVATALLTQQTPSGSAVVVEILLGAVGAGCGLALPSSIAAAVLSVAHTEGGMASASVNTFRQIGSALGASVTGTIITTGLAARLPAALAAHRVPVAARGVITRAIVSGQTPSGGSAALRTVVRSAAGNAFADSLHVATISIAIGAIVIAGVTSTLLSHRPLPAAAPEADPVPPAAEPVPPAAEPVPPAAVSSLAS